MRMSVDAMGRGHAPKMVVQDILVSVSDMGMDDALAARRRPPGSSMFMSSGKRMEKGLEKQDG